ncbi:MAG TPA: hypothetical protein VN493_13595 [Thermoanaerobaculia bacterium]|nr:hypothetical protein [Thermoanaerobaculia bacterium]
MQATDPHVFEKVPKPDAFQEQKNREAFLAFFETLRSLPGSGAKADYLVITGDFGFGEKPAGEIAGASTAPVEAPTPPEQTSPCAATDHRDGRVTCLAELLKASPIRDLYLVPGNNDVTAENGDAASFKSYHDFLDEVERRTGNKVAIHDLTRCYLDGRPLSQCWADIPRSPFRMVGFPSHSFKKTWKDEQLGYMQTLSKLLERAETDGKRVLLLTHIAELDDPHSRATKELKGEQPTDRVPGFELSSWNVAPEVFQEWNRLVRKGAVERVLAGHFHDSHREFYRSPQDWSTQTSNRAPLAKLLLAPPLSIKRQESSPVQARGFSLLRLEGDSLSRRIYWYDPAQKKFEPEPAAEKQRPLERASVLRWFWALATRPLDLSQAGIIAIAFLAAFLTIVELWEIPPPSSSLASPGTGRAGVNPPPPAAGGFGTFKSNFARTVLAGFGGILILDFLDSFWKMPELNAKTYYIVLFVTFFFVMLVLYAFFQALTEALRSRVLTREPGSSWSGRFWHWVLSLRAFFLVLADTLSSVLLGRNQLKTAVFGREIINLHRGIVRAADRIREEIEGAVLQALQKERAQAGDVWVSISVLSKDGSVLFDVAGERGRLAGAAHKVLLALPLPGAHREAAEVVRKVDVQISFRLGDHREAVVEHLIKGEEPDYAPRSFVLEEDSEGPIRIVRDPHLSDVLRRSLGILEELFVPFNETVFDLLDVAPLRAWETRLTPPRQS